MANLLAMTLLVASQFVMHRHAVAYGILLVATTCMGVGFGLTVPAINTFAAAFFPQTVDKAVLTLNTLLGLGTALAPVFVSLFLGLGIWWGLPVLVGVLLAGLLIFSLSQPLNADHPASEIKTSPPRAKFPPRFWIFAAFALLYGICETMNGNWASIYLTHDFKATATQASLALTIFWATVTAGRILFATIEKWFPETLTCQTLPLVAAVAFFISASVPKTSPVLGILSFGLAGLACSALLPLTISFGQKELTTISASVAGGLIAFYQIGYGIAAFGVGPLQSGAGLSFKSIYMGTAVVALALAALSFMIVRPGKTPALELSAPPVKT